MSDKIIHWLESQCNPTRRSDGRRRFFRPIVFPSDKAKATLDEILALRHVCECAEAMLESMEGDWIKDWSDRTNDLVEAIAEYRSLTNATPPDEMQHD